MGKWTNQASGWAEAIKKDGGNKFTNMLFGRRINTNYVFGVLVILDKSNNKHQTLLIPSEPYQHAESAMIEKLRELYEETGIPFDAKIIFYLTKSPCRDCTENLASWVIGAADALGKKHQLYFSFIFSEYYVDTGGDGGNRIQSKMWSSAEEAYKAYYNAQIEADQYAYEAGLGAIGILNIRHITETKQEVDTGYRRKIYYQRY